MLRRDVFQIRIEPALRERLARLRDERHVNVSAWARDVIAAALDREFPSAGDSPGEVTEVVSRDTQRDVVRDVGR